MNQAEQDMLVLSAQEGNRKALGLLVQEYQSGLMGFAFKLSADRELARDAVQEAWIKAAKNIRRLRDPRAFRSWVYRLVRWKTLDMLRASSRQHLQLESMNELASEPVELFQPDSGENLLILINSLPKMEKQMIHLFYLNELSVAEIALVLDIPAGTVKSRLNRARKRLKQKHEQLEE